MKRTLLLVSLVLALSITMASSAFASSAPATRSWTFMVFLNADNNLDRYGIKDVQEMEKAGLSDKINVLVLLDRENLPGRLYDVTGRSASDKADDWGLTSKKIKDMGEPDMGDYRVMVDFVKTAAERYPAENYMLVIWNHGAGWIRGKKGPVFKGISYDDESGNNMTTRDLGIAMAQIQGILGKPLDVLGMDACLMQMIEVAYEVRENVKYICASEETEPGDGWPYDLLLGPVVKNPATTSEELVKLAASAYQKYYASYVEEPERKRKSRAKDSTQSAIDCSKLEAFAGALDNFSQALIEIIPTGAKACEPLRKARSEVQSFYYSDNIDLGHLVKLVLNYSTDSKVKDAAEKLLMAYSRLVMYNGTSGGLKDASGLAIYFPKDYFSTDYASLKYSAHIWDDMVKAFLATKPVFDENSGEYPDEQSPDDLR